VESGGTGRFHLADIVPTTSHLRLAWNAAYDTDPAHHGRREETFLLRSSNEESLGLVFA